MLLQGFALPVTTCRTLGVVAEVETLRSGRMKEDFVGQAACTFHPHTNLHLQPRSRPATPVRQQGSASELDVHGSVAAANESTAVPTNDKAAGSATKPPSSRSPAAAAYTAAESGGRCTACVSVH